jgi:hypothetical protein
MLNDRSSKHNNNNNNNNNNKQHYQCYACFEVFTVVQMTIPFLVTVLLRGITEYCFFETEHCSSSKSYLLFKFAVVPAFEISVSDCVHRSLCSNCYIWMYFIACFSDLLFKHSLSSFAFKFELHCPSVYKYFILEICQN